MVVSLAASGGCGGDSSRSLGTGGAAGAGGTAGVAGNPAAGATGEDAALIELDGPACDRRREADCTGLETDYHSSSGTFDATPELSPCTASVSFDGCGELVYSFDEDGCAVSVGPGRNGWKDADHLDPLRSCLSTLFNAARYSCVASGTVTFHESCFVR